MQPTSRDVSLSEHSLCKDVCLLATVNSVSPTDSLPLKNLLLRSRLLTFKGISWIPDRKTTSEPQVEVIFFFFPGKLPQNEILSSLLAYVRIWSTGECRERRSHTYTSHEDVHISSTSHLRASFSAKLKTPFLSECTLLMLFVVLGARSNKMLTKYRPGSI